MNNLLQQIQSATILTFSLMATLFFSSCNNDIDEFTDAEKKNTITFSTYINENHPTTRMAGTSFEINDEIGVYAVAYQNNNQVEGDIQNSYAPNIKHTYNGTDWILPTETNFPWADGTTKVVLHAYYPYNQASSTTNAKNYPFSVKSDQELKENFTLSDFLWAKSIANTPTINKIPLSFTHRMSKIIINIKSERDFTAEEINNFKINLLNLHLDGEINLSSGVATIQSSSSSKDLKPHKRINPTDGYSITYEAITLPQTLQASSELFSIKSAEGVTPYIYKVPNDLTFSSQKQYTYNITISRTGISITTNDIEDWETTPDVDGNINKPIKKAVDISNINWGSTRIYKVFDKGVQVAEIAKEYLYNGAMIDRQAIVLYPMGANGKVNYTEGFVAQVMGASLNVDNEYIPDDLNIHGGSVVWDNDKITNYTAGTGSLVYRIQIDKSMIKEADPSAVETLTLEPDFLIDIDNNKYGIVKIASVVWMRENLKVEHYRDGSPAETYYYDNSIINKEQLGGLYTWTTVTNSNKLAPTGWHIPDESEFRSLVTYTSSTTLGAAGVKLKAARMWSGNNITGFGALPGGARRTTGSFHQINIYGQWWTTTELSTLDATRMWIGAGVADVAINALAKNNGQSVRCIRD